MTNPETAAAQQIHNIEQSTGRAVADWAQVVDATGRTKHGEILSYLKSEHGLTHGNANALARKIKEAAEGGPPTDADLLATQYSGAKAGLRKIHDEVVLLARTFGEDVTVSVKKTGVSLRRAKQFGLIEVPSARRVELGLNLKHVTQTDRLRETHGMCTHRVALTDPADVDDEVATWLRHAYEQAAPKPDNTKSTSD